MSLAYVTCSYREMMYQDVVNFKPKMLHFQLIRYLQIYFIWHLRFNFIRYLQFFNLILLKRSSDVSVHLWSPTGPVRPVDPHGASPPSRGVAPQRRPHSARRQTPRPQGPPHQEPSVPFPPTVDNGSSPTYSMFQ